MCGQGLGAAWRPACRLTYCSVPLRRQGPSSATCDSSRAVDGSVCTPLPAGPWPASPDRTGTGCVAAWGVICCSLPLGSCSTPMSATSAACLLTACCPAAAMTAWCWDALGGSVHCGCMLPSGSTAGSTARHSCAKVRLDVMCCGAMLVNPAQRWHGSLGSWVSSGSR